MRFYEQLNQYMKVVNCTAKELCTVSGISAAALSRYRSGERVPDVHSETFEQLCSEIDSNYEFLYVGNNEDVINMDRFQNGYTISLSYSLKQTCKTVHFQLSIEELAELLLETNNICL